MTVYRPPMLPAIGCTFSFTCCAIGFLILRWKWRCEQKVGREKQHWSTLSEAECMAAYLLGWEGQMWDEGNSPAARFRAWKDLTPAQRRAAEMLGHSEDTWATEMPPSFSDVAHDCYPLIVKHLPSSIDLVACGSASKRLFLACEAELELRARARIHRAWWCHDEQRPADAVPAAEAHRALPSEVQVGERQVPRPYPCDDLIAT